VHHSARRQVVQAASHFEAVREEQRRVQHIGIGPVHVVEKSSCWQTRTNSATILSESNNALKGCPSTQEQSLLFPCRCCSANQQHHWQHALPYSQYSSTSRAGMLRGTVTTPRSDTTFGWSKSACGCAMSIKVRKIVTKNDSGSCRGACYCNEDCTA
jgi:hypothetical protein